MNKTSHSHHHHATHGQRGCCSTRAPEPRDTAKAGSCCHGDGQPTANELRDPVCGMSVTRESPHKATHEGQDHYFCSGGCRAKFVADPHRYLHREHAGAHSQAAHAHAAPAIEAPPGTIYTCPMHPEVRQDHPGNCPKCGMALEPLLPELSDEEHPELTDFRRRFWWTLPLTIIVTVLAMGGHRFSQARPS